MSHTKCNEVNFPNIACSQLGCCHLLNFSNATLININLSSDRSLSKQYQVVTKPPNETLLHLLMKVKLKNPPLGIFCPDPSLKYIYYLPSGYSVFWLIYKLSRLFKRDCSWEQIKWPGARPAISNSVGMLILSQATERILATHFSCKLTKLAFFAYSSGLPWCWPPWYQQINRHWILTSLQVFQGKR